MCAYRKMQVMRPPSCKPLTLVTIAIDRFNQFSNAITSINTAMDIKFPPGKLGTAILTFSTDTTVVAVPDKGKIQFSMFKIMKNYFS